MKLFMISSEIKVAECVIVPQAQLHREEMQRWMLKIQGGHSRFSFNFFYFKFSHSLFHFNL